MANKRLTEASIGRIPRPESGRKEVSDTEKGLFLHVRHTGSRGWVVVYRVAGAGADGLRGTRVKFSIGEWPSVSLDSARTEARRISELADGGIDVRDQLAASRSEQVAGNVNTIAQSWVKAMDQGQITGKVKRSLSASTISNRKTNLRLHIQPRIGELPMKDVTPSVLGRMLQEIDDSNGPSDETLRTFRVLWSFAVSRGLASGVPPSAGFRARQVPSGSSRALSREELRSIWLIAEDFGYPFGYAIQMLILTGQRRSEIAGAKWEWYDHERRILTIPNEFVKNRSGAHEVVLSDMAAAIMEKVHIVHQSFYLKSEYIFASRSGVTPIESMTKSIGIMNRKRSEAEGRQVPHWRVHDLRHTFITMVRDGEQNSEGEVTWFAMLDVVQATVNHSMRQGITGAYDHGNINVRYRLAKRELAVWQSNQILSLIMN